MTDPTMSHRSDTLASLERIARAVDAAAAAINKRLDRQERDLNSIFTQISVMHRRLGMLRQAMRRQTWGQNYQPDDEPSRGPDDEPCGTARSASQPQEQPNG